MGNLDAQAQPEIKGIEPQGRPMRKWLKHDRLLRFPFLAFLGSSATTDVRNAPLAGHLLPSSGETR